MYRIVCEYCKRQRDDKHKSGVCVHCGHIMKMPPLTDGAFEKIDDTAIADSKKPKREAKE